MDGFFGIGLPELFMIAVIALIVLGPERLPGTIREVAKFIKQVRAIGSELMSQFGDEFKDFQDLDPRRILNEMTDPTKPDDKSKAAPATKPATNSVSKPVTTTTTSTAASAAKSTAAAAAVANSNSASKNESKVEPKSNGTSEAKPASEKVTTDQPEANKSAEVMPTPANTIAPPAALAPSSAETAIATNSSVPNGAADEQTVAVVEKVEPSKSDSQSAEIIKDKPKRTSKAKSKAAVESVEQAVEKSEGEVPHESAN